MGYADVEQLLIDWIPTIAGVTAALTMNPDGSLPGNLAYSLPCVLVDRIGGGDLVVTIDDCTVDVDVFAASRDASREIAETIRAAVRTALPGLTLSGASVVRTRTATGPRRLPYDSRAQVWRYGATYTIRLHAVAGV